MPPSINSNLIETENQYSKIKFDLQGGVLLQWTLKDTNKDIFYNGFDERRSGVPILFPFADNLVKGIYNHTGLEMLRHGFARNLLWSLDRCSEGKIEACISTEDLNDNMKQAYPFDFVCKICMDISKENVLEYKIKVSNKGEKTMAIAPGLHPYFNIDNSQKNQLQIGGLSKFVAKDINWNSELPGGIYFENPGTIKAFMPNGDKLEIIDASVDADNRFSQSVIWSQNIAFPDNNFICIEQFTRPKNGLNDDPILIPEGEEWVGAIKYFYQSK